MGGGDNSSVFNGNVSMTPGIWADLQGALRAGYRAASDLVVGTRGARRGTGAQARLGKLWLGRGSRVERKQLVLRAGCKWNKECGVRWGAGDWTMAV